MKIEFLLSKTVSLTTAIGIVFCMGAVTMAADVENCDMCHKYSGLGRIDETGKKHIYYVNENLYQQSVHSKVRCRECHSDIEKYPHPNPKEVDCSTVCHLVDPATNRKFSHSNMIEKYELSVHGKGPKDQPKQYPEDLPSCTYCHENRVYQPVSGLAEKERGIAQEILDRCLGCHTEDQWTRSIYNHFTHRLHQRRTSRRMVELCASCHEDEERMSRHDLAVTGTFHDTFHWQGIKYDDPNAPNCITCHAPVGYFSHEIMPRDDPRSAIHKDNLVRTCSNFDGLQVCHPNAISSFAQGKIHPARFKTGVFEFKMKGVERLEKIRKGEMKPFQSLRAKPADEEMTTVEYYQQLSLQLIKYFYMFLIGGLISFMIIHQLLDYFATRREMKEGGTHR
jgi:hypothetical protein